MKNGAFVQHGCAPNYQGGYITLCTCKHQMRARRPESGKWTGAWIAGVTSRSASRGFSGEHHLFYLMRVASEFESHMDLWHKAGLSGHAKQSKCASISEFGDLFRPHKQNGEPFNIQSYDEPVLGHRHHRSSNDRNWHKDICYPKSRSGRRPALLVGEPAHSFLWTRPSLSFTRKLPRDYLHRHDLKGFLGALRDAAVQ